MGKTTSPCSFPAWGGSPGAELPLEPSPGALSGWAVMDVEAPHPGAIVGHSLSGILWCPEHFLGAAAQG